MSPVATTLVILALAVVAFMSNRIPLGIVAIGVSVSENVIGNATINGDPHLALTEAAIVSSTVGTPGQPVGPVNVTATSNGRIHAFTVAGAVGVGVGSGAGIGGSLAGSGSSNSATGVVNAHISGGTLRSGAVSVQAATSTWIVAEAGAGAIGLGVGVAAVGAGVVLIATSGSGKAEAAARPGAIQARVYPSVGPGGGGLTFAGSFW